MQISPLAHDEHCKHKLKHPVETHNPFTFDVPGAGAEHLVYNDGAQKNKNGIAMMLRSNILKDVFIRPVEPNLLQNHQEHDGCQAWNDNTRHHLEEIIITILGLLCSNLHCFGCDQHQKDDNDGTNQRENVCDELTRLLQWLQLVLTSKLLSPLGMFCVILLVNAFKLRHILVYIEDQLD